jgi:hypothetical protein
VTDADVVVRSREESGPVKIRSQHHKEIRARARWFLSWAGCSLC